MIIVFHSLYFIVRYLRKIYQVSKNVGDFQKCHLVGSEVTFQSNCTVDDAFNVKFDPPLYKQRYAIVQQILLNENYRPNIKKIVEFGCGELNFFVYLKNLFGITEILCVDIDKEVLIDNQCKVQPLTVDYLKRRSEKLNVQLFRGSVADPDIRLLGAHAVIAIELIEHLYPDTLDALPYNIFGFIQPLIVIFTTPNVEFNAVFKLDNKFRHHDHKFEWTRSQFEDWCRNITHRFPKYYVLFDGVGPGPEGTEHLGKCTQIAVFIKEDREILEKPILEPLSEVPRSCRVVRSLSPAFEEQMTESYGVCTYYSHSMQVRLFDGFEETNTPGFYYEQIDVVDYPYTVDNRTPEQRILDEVLYKIYSCSSRYSELYNQEKNRVEYPLNLLVSNEDGYFTTAGEIKTLLERENFTIEECSQPGDEGAKTLCVVYDLVMDNKSSSPGSDENLSDDPPIKVPWTLACVEETDWETEYNNTKQANQDNLETDDNLEPLPSDKCDVVVVANTQQFCFDSNENEASMSAGTSNNRQSSKSRKGTDVKNRNSRSLSLEKDDSKRNSSESKRSSTDTKKMKKTIELKVKDSSHSSAQASSSNRSTRSNKPSSSKSKIPMKPPKKCASKIEDSVASTSAAKKKRKPKKGDEDRDDIKTLTECIVYNTLNNITDAEIVSETSNEITNTNNDCKDSGITELAEDILSIDFPQEVEIIQHAAATEVVVEFLEGVLESAEFTNADLKRELQEAEEQCVAVPVQAVPGNTEVVMTALNMASREALFDSNSEIDMLEEFEIPAAPVNTNSTDNPPVQTHPNVILIGLNLNTDDEGAGS